MFPNDTEYSFDNLPNIHQYITDILDFDKISLEDKNEKQIHDLYFQSIKILPLQVFSSPLTGRNFFRVRSLKTITPDEDLTQKKVFSYPPAKFCNNGRANLKHSSVFYCSDSYITTFYESKMEIGESGYLSIWKCKSESSINYGCILPSNLDKRNRWYNHINNLYVDNLKIGKLHEKSIQELYATDYIAEKFITEKEPYKLTSFISHAILYSTNPVAFLVYPSVQSSLIKCNIAFNPKSADEHLELEKVIKFLILKKDNQNIEFRLLEIGENKNGIINWREANEIDLKQLKE